MRKTFLTKGFVRFSRGLAGAALIAATIGITSCETHSNSDRNESIKVYADPIAKEPIDAGIVGVKGGLAKLYVDANIDFVATWEDDAATPWAKVVDYSSTDPQTGLRVITLKANRRSTTSSYYTRRTGMLILAASDGELNYNRIIPIHQGSISYGLKKGFLGFERSVVDDMSSIEAHLQGQAVLMIRNHLSVAAMLLRQPQHGRKRVGLCGITYNWTFESRFQCSLKFVDIPHELFFIKNEARRLQFLFSCVH